MSDRVRAALVTVVGLVVFALVHRIVIPGVDLYLLGEFGAAGVVLMSIGAMAVAPWFTAFVLVECVLIVVPAWRRYRWVGADRRAVDGVVRVVWLVVCVVQAFGTALGLEQMTLGLGSLVMDPGWPWRVVFMASVTAASALVGWTAVGMARRGLGAAFVWFFAAGMLFELLDVVDTLSNMPHVRLDDVLPVAICMAVVTGATYWLVVARGRTGLWLSAAGTVPFSVGSAGLLWCSMYVPSLWSTAGFALTGLLILAGTVVLSMLQTLPAEAVDPDDADQSDRWRAALAGVVFSAVVCAVWWTAGAADTPLYINPITVAVLFAVGWDVLSEWRARGGHTYAIAGSIHRVRDVQPVAEVLRQAGIRFHIRGVRLRQLTHVLTPWADMDVLVDPTQVNHVAVLLADLHKQGVVGDDTTPDMPL